MSQQLYVRIGMTRLTGSMSEQVSHCLHDKSRLEPQPRSATLIIFVQALALAMFPTITANSQAEFARKRKPDAITTRRTLRNMQTPLTERRHCIAPSSRNFRAKSVTHST